MLGTHKKSASSGGTNNKKSFSLGYYNSAGGGISNSDNNNSSSSSSGSSSSSRNNNHDSHFTESSPKSMSARLSVGMMPYFIPPPPQPTLGNGNSERNSPLDPTLMTPPMSPTESSFGFPPSIESRFASSPPTLTSHFHSHSHSPSEQRSKVYSTNNHTSTTSTSSPYPFTSSSSSSSTTVHSVTGPFSTPISNTGASPRNLTFHWDQHQEFEQEDSEDQDEEDSEDEDDEYEDSVMKARNAYQRQFEGHHSLVRRSSSFEGRRRRKDKDEYESRYTSYRHGIGASISDMSDELAKARSKISGATRAMKSMEQELEVMQKNIDESKVSSASARSAIEENFWRLECLALTIEKDRQETSKKLQEVNRDCGEAIEAVTNWEVRIDWLEKKVDNTSEYVSELVLSEQECMSFIKMIIQQNKRYAMPAISRATERNIKLLAPPRHREISHPSVQPDIRRPLSPQPQQMPQPVHPQPSVRHIPISWLLEPIMPPKPPEIMETIGDTSDSSRQEKRSTVEPPAELWRDFSRLTTAFESGQARTPFTPFQRARSQSSSGRTLLPVSGINSGGSSSANIGSSGVNNTSNSSGSINNSAVQNGNVFKSSAIIRRPQVENLSPMPKLFPMVAANKIPVVKRRNQHLAHLPVHSWLQFQFNKTITTPGNLGRDGPKKRTTVLGFKPITIFQTTV